MLGPKPWGGSPCSPPLPEEEVSDTLPKDKRGPGTLGAQWKDNRQQSHAAAREVVTGQEEEILSSAIVTQRWHGLVEEPGQPPSLEMVTAWLVILPKDRPDRGRAGTGDTWPHLPDLVILGSSDPNSYFSYRSAVSFACSL